MQFLKEVNNLLYGEARIVEDKRSKKTFAIKTFILNSKEEFDEYLSAAHCRKDNLNTLNIAKVIDIRTEINEHLCSILHKITLLYEYHEYSLEK